MAARHDGANRNGWGTLVNPVRLFQMADGLFKSFSGSGGRDQIPLTCKITHVGLSDLTESIEVLPPNAQEILTAMASKPPGTLIMREDLEKAFDDRA